MVRIVPQVNSCLPAGLDEDAADFYKFDLSCFQNLFPPNEYGDSLAVLLSIENAIDPSNAATYRDKRIIIAVDDVPSLEESQTIGGRTFDLQVVCVVRVKKRGTNQSKYDAVRYMRHSGFNCFWKQERNELIVTQCITRDDIYSELEES